MNENEKKVLVHIDNYTGDKPIPLCVREAGVLKLMINATNSRNGFSADAVDAGMRTDNIDLLPCSTITGRIEQSKEFSSLHINDDEYFWHPQKLAKFLRLNRHLFADPEEGMFVISILKNIKAKITGAYEKAKDNANGTLSRTDFFQENIEHNLPPKFSLMFNVLKGSPKEKFDIEIDADLVDGDIAVQLVSPSINSVLQSMNDELIDIELARIESLAPGITFIEK